MLCIIPHAGHTPGDLSNPLPVAGFGRARKPPQTFREAKRCNLPECPTPSSFVFLQVITAEF